MPKRAKSHKTRILVAAAEPQLQKLLKLIFTVNGYKTLFVAEGTAAILTHTAPSPELVVLDLDLPDLSGHEEIREIRRISDVPVIALSGRHAEADLVAALDLGADDYVEKPFRAAELLARIRSVLRRGLKTKGEEAVYHCGAILIDTLDHSATRGGEPIRLAPKEFEILSLLVRNSGRVVSYQQLIESPSGEHYCRNKQALRTTIWSLRQKLEDDPDNPRIVLTENRIGYRLARSPDGMTRGRE